MCQPGGFSPWNPCVPGSPIAPFTVLGVWIKPVGKHRERRSHVSLGVRCPGAEATGLPQNKPSRLKAGPEPYDTTPVFYKISGTDFNRGDAGGCK